jgi:hypothetical protein
MKIRIVLTADIAEILLKVALRHQKIKSKADYINNHILNVFKYIFNIQLIIKLQNATFSSISAISAVNRVHPFCNLQSRAQTHSILGIGLYELLDPTT